MGVLNKLSRRAVLAGKAALAGLAVLPAAARARAPGVAGPAAQAPGGEGAAVLPPRWHDATAEELAALVGQRFRATSPAHGALALKLEALEPGVSGAARPAHLPRREGVVAIFDSPDAGPLIAEGGGHLTLWHRRMGAAELYATAVPRRSGGARIEIVLN